MFSHGKSARDEDTEQYDDIDVSIYTICPENPAALAPISCERSERNSPSSSAVLYSSPCPSSSSSAAAAEEEAVLTPTSSVEDTNRSTLILAEPVSEGHEVGEEVERAGLLTKHAAILSEILGLRTPPASSGRDDSDDDGYEEGRMSAVCPDTEGGGNRSGNGHVAGGNELGNDDMDGARAGWVDVRMIDTEDEKEQRMNVKRRRVRRGSSPMSSEVGLRTAVEVGNESAEEKFVGEGGEGMDLCACQYCPGHRKRASRRA